MVADIKRIALLGSTGSIGQQTLEVVAAFPDRFKVVALAAGRNTKLLAKQVRQFQPQLVYPPLNLSQVPRLKFAPPEEMASHPDIDLVVIATSGKSGLLPTLSALKAGKTVALANKEVLVMAGKLVTGARKYPNQIIPVDSEHSAIWQCLAGENSRARRLWLTASGGPFYHYSPDMLAAVTAEAALEHPVWKMGKKITIDSATLMNKGLEIIEAHWLFRTPLAKIEVLMHPQSIIHSMVEFEDYSLKAQLGFPDMRLPIQYALSYPERLSNSGLPRLDLGKMTTLTFAPVESQKFPCLELAKGAGKDGGTYPAVLCAADEIAVELFLGGKIKFTDIPRIIEETLSQHHGVHRPSLEEIMAADSWAREKANYIFRKMR